MEDKIEKLDIEKTNTEITNAEMTNTEIANTEISYSEKNVTGENVPDMIVSDKEHPDTNHSDKDHSDRDHPINDNPDNDHPINDHPDNDHPDRDHSDTKTEKKTDRKAARKTNAKAGRKADKKTNPKAVRKAGHRTDKKTDKSADLNADLNADQKVHNKNHKKRKSGKRGKATLLFLGVLSLIAIVQYIVVCQSLDQKTIWGNAYLNDVSIGGLSKEAAAEKVQSRFAAEYQDKYLTVDLAGQKYQIPVYDALALDASDAINKLYKLGHGPWLLRGFDWLKMHLSGSRTATVYPYVANSAAFKEGAKSSGLTKFNSQAEPKWEVRDNNLVITKGRESAELDASALMNLMVKAVEEHNFTDEISCPATFSPPKEVNLEEVAADVCADMVNATLDPNNSYAIVPSKTGVTFDRALAQSMYDSAAAGQEIVVPLTVAQPDVTTEDLQTKLFRDTLASYYTYAGGTEARLQNISKAAASCSGTILLPGETFSYNQALGERTLERGYQKAGAYSYNEVIEEIGGGICQVSSTIFSAVLYTELAVDERNNHSMPVSYLPQGMDAAVSWGSLDFVFRNTYDYPVKLNVSFDGYTIGVEILGTKEDGHYIDIRLDQLDAYSAKTTRLVYDSNGSLISEELIAYSNYQNPDEKKNTEEQEQATETETETETENNDTSGEYTNNDENSETTTGGNDGTNEVTDDDGSDRYWDVVEDPYGDSIGDQVDLYGDAPDYTYNGTYDTEAYWE